jgi:hypothetical protein
MVVLLGLVRGDTGLYGMHKIPNVPATVLVHDAVNAVLSVFPAQTLAWSTPV